MSRYFDALKRSAQLRGLTQTQALQPDQVDVVEPTERGSRALPLPVAPSVVGNMARHSGLRRLNERVAPLATVVNPVRILLCGCRPGDGTTSVAAALAVDMSQRLCLPTLLVDAHLRHPSIARLFGGLEHVVAGSAGSRLRLSRTSWPRLDLGVCLLPRDERHLSTPGDWEAVLGEYPVAIVDLGVVRLDPRMLMLARPADPVLLVARCGHSERRDLSTTTSALRAANRAIGGVILNDRRDPVPNLIRRILGGGAINEF